MGLGITGTILQKFGEFDQLKCSKGIANGHMGVRKTVL